VLSLSVFGRHLNASVRVVMSRALTVGKAAGSYLMALLDPNKRRQLDQEIEAHVLAELPASTASSSQATSGTIGIAALAEPA
jgi:hypothetical protein